MWQNVVPSQQWRFGIVIEAEATARRARLAMTWARTHAKLRVSRSC